MSNDSLLSNRPTRQNKLPLNYHQISNIIHTLAGNKTVDHSDAVGALPAGAALTTSSFLTQHLASIDCMHAVGYKQVKFPVAGSGIYGKN